MTADVNRAEATQGCQGQFAWWLMLILGSVALYAPTRSFPGTQDVAVITGWLDEALRVGLAEGLTVPRDYPPGSTALHWLLVVTGTLSLDSVVKTTNLVTLVLFAGYSAKSDAVRGVQVLGAFALSSAFLGYTDILFAPFALILARTRVAIWALTCSFIAMVLLKWTALIAAPLVIARLVRSIRVSNAKSVVQQLLPAGLLVGVVALFFSPLVLLDKFQYAMKTTVAPSANALNIHWIFSMAAFDGAPYGSPVYDDLWPIYEPAFTLLTLAFTCGFALLWLSAGAPHDLWLVALRGAFSAYFLLAYSVHENHLFLAVIFTLFGYWKGTFPGWQLSFIVMFFNANLILFYGFAGNQRPIEGYEWVGLVSAAIGTVALVIMTIDDAQRLLAPTKSRVASRLLSR